MNKAQTDGTLRHLLGVIGTLLVSFKIADEQLISAGIDTVMAVAGAASIVIAFIASIKAKSKK